MEPSLAQPENPQRDIWIELALNVLCPTVVLIFLSGDDWLGPKLGLVVGLSFPLAHAAWSLFRGDTISPLSFVAVISVTLTGGIGLLELDASWFAVKEALLPLVLAAFTWGSRWTRWPVIDTLLFRLFDREKIAECLDARGRADELEPLLDNMNRWFIASFFYSAVVSYFLALYMVTSDTGTSAFNEELGRFTFVSFPVIAIPMTVAMGFALNRLLTGLEAATDVDRDDLLRPGLAPAKKEEEEPEGT